MPNTENGGTVDHVVSTPARRPAETAAPVAMAAAFVIAKIAGVEDVDTIGYIAILVSFVPAAVTFIADKIKR